MVLRRCFMSKRKIDKHAQIQAIVGMGKKWPAFPVSILDVMQRAKLASRSENANSLNPKAHLS